MIRSNLLALAVVISVGATAAANARSPSTQLEWRPRADANSDGYIDRSEAAAMPRLAERFDTLDTDRDGRLSRKEMPRRQHGPGAHAAKASAARAGMMRMDTDGDRHISRAEAAAGSARMAGRFDAIDLNGDGFLDREDRLQRARQRSAEWFTSADTDSDGQLSRAEFDAAHARRMRERQVPHARTR